MKVLAIAAAVALGILAGALIVHSWLAPVVADLTGEVESLKMEVARKQAEVEKLQSRGLRMEEQLASLERHRETGAEAPEEAVTATDSEDESAAMEVATGPVGAASRDRRDRRSRPGEPEASEGESPGEAGEPTAEERSDRMRSFENRVREQVGSFLDQEYARAPDAATQERLQVLQGYMEQIGELRTAMRDAQTDEERDALRQSMRESFGNVRDIVVEQQDSMLRTLAANSGITDPAKQDAFVSGMRELQSSPFFRPEQAMMMGGGGPMAWGGGWGGERGERRGGRP